jgi:hypothetical protein
MALGNSNSSSQSRGKNKPVIVKRRKEVVAARGYNSFQVSSALTGIINAQGICSSSASISNTVYHNGSSAAPVANDLVYSRARASEKYLLEDGYYRASISSANHYLIIASGRVQSCGTCR